MDGGFTRWNEFEKLPKGWEHVSEVGDVCPNCFSEYKNMLDDYKRTLKEWSKRENKIAQVQIPDKDVYNP